MKLYYKISVGIFVLVVGLVVTVMGVVDYTSSRAIEEKIQKDLIAAKKVFENFHALRLQNLLNYNQIVAQTPYMKALTTSPDLDPEIIREIAEKARQNIGSDFLMILNAKKELVIEVYDAHSHLEEIRSTEAVSSALEGNDFWGTFLFDEHVVQLVASPFKFGEEVAGVLLTGFVMDEEVILKLQEMTNTHVAIFSAGRLETSAESARLFEAFNRLRTNRDDWASGRMYKELIHGERFLFWVDVFESGHEIQCVLGRSLDQELSFYLLLRIQLLGAAAMVLCAALFLGLIYARRLTRPLVSLTRGVDQIAQGEFEASVPVKTHDEIGQLAMAFNQMTGNLKKSHEKLVSAHNDTSNIIHSMIDMLLVTTPNGTIRMVNQALCKILGYRKSELLGKNAQHLFSSSEEGEEFTFDSLLEGKAIRNQESVYVAKDGRRIPVSCSASAMKSAKGTIDGIVFVAQDIHEKKQLEARANQSEKMAAIGQLAGGVAHEINNPLGVILGFADIAARHVKEGDRVEKPISIIRKEAIRCRDLVQDLLTFSRKRKAEKALIDISEIVEGAVSLIKAQTRVKNIEFVREIEQGLPKTMANHTQIQQIILNLANNAIDSMPKSGTLKVKTQAARKHQKDWIEIVIEDTGTGIPKEMQDKIFQPFFTTKDVGSGTGLGLALVYEIVQKHNGEISVESELGKGTQFHVLLPIEKEDTIPRGAEKTS